MFAKALAQDQASASAVASAHQPSTWIVLHRAQLPKRSLISAACKRYTRTPLIHHVATHPLRNTCNNTSQGGQTSCQVLDLQIKNSHHTMQSIPAEQLLKLTTLFSLPKKIMSKLSTKLNEIHHSQFFKLLLQEWSYDLTPAHTSSDTYVATHSNRSQ